MSPKRSWRHAARQSWRISLIWGHTLLTHETLSTAFPTKCAYQTLTSTVANTRAQLRSTHMLCGYDTLALSTSVLWARRVKAAACGGLKAGEKSRCKEWASKWDESSRHWTSRSDAQSFLTAGGGNREGSGGGSVFPREDPPWILLSAGFWQPSRLTTSANNFFGLSSTVPVSDHHDEQTVSEPARTNQGHGTLHRSRTHGLGLPSLALVMDRGAERGQLWGGRRGRGLGNGSRTTRYPERGQRRTMLFLVSLALQSQVSRRLSAIFSRPLTPTRLQLVSMCVNVFFYFKCKLTERGTIAFLLPLLLCVNLPKGTCCSASLFRSCLALVDP